LIQALQGVKIVDFSWVAAGPLTTRVLADFGATVIKIESSIRPDPLRFEYPFANNMPGINRSVCFAIYNANKYSMALNMSISKGRDIAKRLIKQADVVIDNFTPGTMERWGLGYNELIKIKSDIIMLNLTLQGQTGSYSKQPGLGFMLQALGGFTSLLGWPDRTFPGTQLPYTDYIGCYFAAVAIVEALEYRRRTGKGQYIDVSQLESGISFLSSAILDYTVNGRVEKVKGNRCPYAAPHGAYRCRGEDRWCTIAVFTDHEWQALCQLIGSPALRGDKFATLLGRKRNEDELNHLIEEWTINYSAEEVMERLQSSGIACGIVETGEDMHRDPQLKHRQYFWFLEHPEIGVTSCSAPPIQLSKTPPRGRMPAPCLGEHTEFVCTNFLGMSDEEFVELSNEGVFR